jgi:hypothetical protein
MRSLLLLRDPRSPAQQRGQLRSRCIARLTRRTNQVQIIIVEKIMEPAPLILQRAFHLPGQEFAGPVSVYPTRCASFSSNLICRTNHPHDVIIKEIALTVNRNARNRTFRLRVFVCP